MTATKLYRRDGADAVTACALDDIVLLYHPRSEQTHMVISPVPEILDQLADGGPASVAQIHDRLARSFDLGPADEAIDEIAAHLDALVALGLVRPA
ncbi:MAG: HPr-rel-A system PqqD family peptide chaperone [Pseudomonadota bacterium]|uniref:HPr-rel-A system PqqD family protein n=1 Tax=Sphingobium xenophagum TaxID=121428 RepID=A0A249MTV5_SPHXE|nr:MULTISPECIES: HPr-rel-A system PqqD family peptide chaperone [Sphingobium]ASY44722.1 HPr-rel-A system PqqD family protein [Sphingobium xenophagum]OUC53903.1 HPr-rel-A system PqqD family protein [Sphingobium sp. GW456-12-10-14-TSB1]QWT14939.1 HPr-rel-A system PqqD family peptide chaperone [Sphingobium xenophagum]